MAIQLQDYYSRYGTGRHGDYERVLYRTGRVVQGAELNETQEAQIDRVRRIADVLFKDGSIIRDARIVVNPNSGAVTAESGAVYVRGAVRGLPPATFTIALSGTVQIGVYLRDLVVTELEDPSLRDPAQDVLNYSEGGAARLRVDALWGFQGDGQSGEFYPVYTVVNGVILSKEPPPQIDGVAVAIADYDLASTGGNYVDSGLRLTLLPDVNGDQVYSLTEGSARVNGRAVRLAHALRLTQAATPDLKEVVAEPHAAAGGSERVTLNHGPIHTVTQVTITVERTVTLQHGGFAGVADALPDSPVIALASVTQGAVTYVQGTDYKLTSDKVDWSLTGAEVAPGSTYSVTYRCIKTVTPTAVDATGLTISGAVPGTLVNTTYKWRLPRVDRLCLGPDGSTTWIVGTPSETTPSIPNAPSGLLPIASVLQSWDANRKIVSDATRAVSMSQLEAMQTRIDTLFALVATQQLRVDATIADPAAKKGIFADPFLDNDLRDPGLAQDAAVINGELMLPIEAAIIDPKGSTRVTLDYELDEVLAQTKRTGSMLINPYMAFDPIPATVTLTPEVDFWTQIQTQWTGDSTTRFIQTGHVTDTSHVAWTSTSVSEEVVGSATAQIEHLRPITVAFTIKGFGPNEVLDKVTFDGLDVTPV